MTAKNISPPGDLVSVADAAERFGLPLKTVYRWANTGRIASARVGYGRRTLVSVSDIDAELNTLIPGPKAPAAS